MVNIGNTHTYSAEPTQDGHESLEGNPDLQSMQFATVEESASPKPGSPAEAKEAKAPRKSKKGKKKKKKQKNTGESAEGQLAQDDPNYIDVSKLVYASSRLDRGHSPTVLYLPSVLLTFKLMRSCVGVYSKEDFWFNQGAEDEEEEIRQENLRKQKAVEERQR